MPTERVFVHIFRLTLRLDTLMQTCMLLDPVNIFARFVFFTLYEPFGQLLFFFLAFLGHMLQSKIAGSITYNAILRR
jgi:TRAP-type C4-dicarboxylate transport system permease small subunit